MIVAAEETPMLVRPDRLLPSLAVGGLLVFALLGATDPRLAPAPAVPASMYYPNCTDLLESATPESALTLNSNDGIVQPLGSTGNIAVCSLGVQTPYYSYGAVLQVQSWDPVALAPDPTTVALRTTTYYISSYYNWLSKLSYVPPIVIKSLANVAEPPRATAAVSFENSAAYAGAFTAHWTPSATPDVPTAYHYVNHGARIPFAGTQPAISHFICGGDQALQNLFVTQSVIRADSMYGNDVSVVVQRFRVQQRVQVYWAELAFGPVTLNNPNGFLPGSIAILDAQGQAQPPSNTSSALVSASFQNSVDRPAWFSHFDFDRVATLEPHHDYWLWVSPIWDYGLFVRHRAATESVPFTAGVGECWFLKGANPPWTPDPGNVLDFKIIGLPLDVTGIPSPPPVATSELRLRIGPNPSHGTTMIAWTGSRGPLRFEVLDARGRRVARGEGSGTGAGQWLFHGTRDDGRPLPAGVYFVRAVDAGGQAAVERVVLVR
jgi:hypothetical protein